MVLWLCAKKKDEPWIAELHRLRDDLANLIRQLELHVRGPKGDRCNLTSRQTSGWHASPRENLGISLQDLVADGQERAIVTGRASDIGS